MPHETKTPCELFVYDISHCGLYVGRETSPKHLSIGFLLKDLKQWAIDSTKPIIETSTFTKGHRFEEAYCLDLVSSNGQYLLALWNRVPHSKSGIGMINGSKAASAATMSHSKINAEDIPGYPTFFWFLPSSKKMVAIKIENPALGIAQLRAYLKGYLNNFCSYRIKKQIDGNTIEGFSDFPKPKSGKDQRVINSKLHSHFRINAKSIPGIEKEFLNRHDDVVKLSKDIYVYNNLSDSNATWLEKLSSMFNGLPATKKKKARVQMPVSLTRSDVQELIDEYKKNDYSQEYNVGFVYKGKSNHIEWLSGSQQKVDEDITVYWKTAGQPDLTKLLKGLQSIEHLIKPEKEDDSEEENEHAV